METYLERLTRSIDYRTDVAKTEIDRLEAGRAALRARPAKPVRPPVWRQRSTRAVVNLAELGNGLGTGKRGVARHV
jgi:hypothetical protein